MSRIAPERPWIRVDNLNLKKKKKQGNAINMSNGKHFVMPHYLLTHRTQK